MIRHIVLFKLKDFSSESEREDAIQNVLATFRSLIGQVPQIRQYRVEKNMIEGNAAFDVIIDSTFDSADDLRAYQSHPAHLDAVALNREWSAQKVTGDYYL